MRWLFLLLLAAVPLAAQDPAQNAAISGTVKDASTGQPVAGYTVFTFQGKGWQSTTDPNGRYRLADIPPGSYTISARAGAQFGPTSNTRRVRLAGRDLDNIDFRVVRDGAISGSVVDEYKEPVPDTMVYLVSREYYLGNIGYYFKAATRTDDRGHYTLALVTPGHPYLLLAGPAASRLEAHSNAPLDPKLRRRAVLRTWYPNSPVKESAGAITVRPGEQREGVDIEVKRSASYCISGTLSGPGGPAELAFSLEPLQPSSGISRNGGMYVAMPAGRTGGDGQFRICDLAPGAYRFTAMDRPANMGFNAELRSFMATTITIADRDLNGLKFATAPGVPLEGEVVWDGPAPDKPVETRLGVFLQAMLRTTLGEKADARVDIPGAFRLPSLPLDDYSIRLTLNASGLYVKDVAYAGRSIKNEVFHFGAAAPGAGLRVTVARDGGFLDAAVTDKDGNPQPDVHVIYLPAEIPSEAALAELVESGLTDQAGAWESSTLAPGKYYVAASTGDFDSTVESIARLWRSRTRFQEVNVPPGGSAAVKLEPIDIQ